jgi:hypothetical protein
MTRSPARSVKFSPELKFARYRRVVSFLQSSFHNGLRVANCIKFNNERAFLVRLA